MWNFIKFIKVRHRKYSIFQFLHKKRKNILRPTSNL